MKARGPIGMSSRNGHRLSCAPRATGNAPTFLTFLSVFKHANLRTVITLLDYQGTALQTLYPFILPKMAF
jgi:hypothetical protein